MQSSAFARHLRHRQTNAEGLVWLHLRRRQISGHYFRRQCPIGPYVVDFVCKRAKLIVEIDGSQHGARRIRDARRTAYLEGKGYDVVRFWNHEVFTNLDGVLETIFAHLQTPS